MSAYAQQLKEQHVVFPSSPVKSPTGVTKQPSIQRERDREQPQQPQRERDPRAVAQAQAPSPAAASLAKAAGGQATPRRREKKDPGKETDIVKRLQQICTDADPTRLYRNLVRIGQG
jgi:p21-activated kinase 1